jgi:glyoxylase-like metal-dependent hydrolase (beta-lactamase superfamily II)
MPESVEITGNLQHVSWLAKTLPPVEQVRTDLWSIPIPMGDSPLRYVSVYVLSGESGLTLIDAGWDSDESWAALCDGLTSFGASVSDVTGCLVSHQHIDHIGMANRIRESSGAWIGLHPADRDAIMRREFREPRVAARYEIDRLISFGASPDEAARLLPESYFAARETIPIPDRLVEDGDELVLPGWRLRAIHTPGHTPGHLCFVDDKRRLLFAGDHVLPRISPNISAGSIPNEDALGKFLASLESISNEVVDEVLPAHEWRFRGLRRRTQELREHHDKRLLELLAVVLRHPDSVPWDLAGKMTWSRPWDQYDSYIRVLAVNETVAHLDHLVRRGLVEASSDTVSRYRLAPTMA